MRKFIVLELIILPMHVCMLVNNEGGGVRYLGWKRRRARVKRCLGGWVCEGRRCLAAG